MLLCSFVIRWEMAPTFSAFKSSPDTSWVRCFWPIRRRPSCCQKDIIIIWGCDLDTCLFQMGEMMEGRAHVEVSCGRNGTVLTADKWLWEHTIGGTRDCLGPMKWPNIFTLAGKAFFSLSREKQYSGSYPLMKGMSSIPFCSSQPSGQSRSTAFHLVHNCA